MSLADVPIRRKLLASILVTSVVVMMLMLGVFMAYNYGELRKAMVRQITSLGDLVGVNATASLAFENAGDAHDVLAALRSQRRVSAAALYDREGHLFAQYPDKAPVDALPTGPGDLGYRYGERYLDGFREVVEREQRLGTLYLRFDQQTVLRDWLSGSLPIVAVVSLLVLLVAYLLSLALERQISRPILALAGTAKEVIAQHDFSLRAEKHGHDEIGELTVAFNGVLLAIEERERALSTFNEALRQENAERRRAEEALRAELRRQAAERAVAQVRTIAVMALGVWMLSAALGVWLPNMRTGAGRWLLGGGWTLLLFTLGCAFFAWQQIESWSASDQLPERSTTVAELVAPWFLLLAIALSAAALLVAL